MMMTVRRKKQSWYSLRKVKRIRQPPRNVRLLQDQPMLGITGQNGMPFTSLNDFLQMRLLRLIVGLRTKKIRRLLAIAQLSSENGSMSFQRAKWMKQ